MSTERISRDTYLSRLKTKARILFGSNYSKIGPEQYEAVVRPDYHRDKIAKSLADFVLQYIPIPAQGEPPKILDIAAGTGIVARALHKNRYRVAATDRNQKFLDYIKEQTSDIETQPGNMNDRLHFEDNSCDGATTLWANRYIKDTPTFLREVHRILKPGGVFVWPIFPLDRLGWKMRSRHFIKNPTKSSSIVRAAKRVGFSETEVVRKPLGEMPASHLFEKGVRFIVLKK